MGKFRSWESKFFKICGIMGGLLFILFGIAFVYSHGTTPQNRMLHIFGIDQVVVLTALAILVYSCLGTTLVSLNKYAMKTSRIGRFSYRLVQLSYLTLLISIILQNIVVDPHTEWDSPISIMGWILQNISWLLFTIGMVIVGLLVYKIGFSRRIGLFSILLGLFAFLTFFGDLMIYSFSSGSVLWDIIHAAIYFPFGLVWILLAFHISKQDTFN